MKKYTEKTDFWKTAKILGYLANFLNNHQGMIFAGSIFKPVTDLLVDIDWEEWIKSRFPEKAIEPEADRDFLPFPPGFADAPQEMLRKVWNTPLTREAARAMLLGEISRLREKYSPAKYSDDRFSLRAAQLKSTLALSDLELDILLVLALVVDKMCDSFEVHRHSPSEHDKATFIAKCLDCDISEILAAMDEKSKLRRYNCVDEDFDFNPTIWRFLNGVRNEPLSSCYFKLYTDETLPWEFYGTLAEKHGGILKRIINGANGSSPVNILLYGASGTGKTSFARTLAAELKRKCYIVAQDTHERRSNEASSTPAFRFGALQICNSRVEPTESIIIVDEADEMLRSGSGSGPFSFFGGSGAPAGDKGLLNAVLDTVTTPTIWITNTSAAELDESSRRRFDYSIRFEALNAEQRLSIWRNNVGKMELSALVSEEMMRKFAARYPVSAGGITLVLQNLAKLAPEPSEVESLVETLMKPHCELLGVSDDDTMRPAEDYSLDGLNIKGTLPLTRLVEAVQRFQQGTERGADRPRMNILLSGAPGTGKTEFVKYLGVQLGTKVIVRMGSDLLDMYVGNTEKLIRQAFAQAEAEKAILFLDEIDGLLQSRERAHRSWEVTQVNELLHRMENFKGIMLGATNFAANLDAAVLRRFTFKLEFDYLDEAGKQLFFERMFRATLTASEAAMLARIPHLTPGDFRTVRQGLFYLGGDVSNAELLDALKQESAAKSANRYAEKGKMGF